MTLLSLLMEMISSHTASNSDKSWVKLFIPDPDQVRCVNPCLSSGESKLLVHTQLRVE